MRDEAPGEPRASRAGGDVVARLLLSVAVLLPYWPLLTLGVLHVTDDGFASDIWNGELPGRVIVGRALREGVLPMWTSQSCSGTPLFTTEPLSPLLFSTLSVSAALDVLLIAWLLIAAHGSYGLARQLGASRAGAWLAGFSFALSGYLAAQLKHLTIVSTVVWLPWGLLLIARAVGAQSLARRSLYVALFACVLGEQALSAFPQSAFICALAYAAFALYSVLAQREPSQSVARSVGVPLALLALGALAGVALGAAQLMPLAELGALSDRGQGNTFEWATQMSYWPQNALMFLSPYIHGDVSDGSYHGKGLFWEAYGYVGIATFVLALYALVRGHRDSRVLFLGGLALAAFTLVLGPATPVFRFVFENVPGFGLFRFPTRFLVVVDLCLCLLAARGLSQLPEDLTPLLQRVDAAGAIRVLVPAICIATFMDLLAHQPRQNPMVPASEWLEPPLSARVLQSEPGTPRIFTPYHMEFHMSAYHAARGWDDLRPYYALRDLVQPNSNVYWGLATADCYAGLSPRWYVDAWGDHSRGSLLVYRLLKPQLSARTIQALPAFVAVLRAYGVTHVLSPLRIPVLEPKLELPELEARAVNLYRVPGAKRVRVVEQAVVEHDTDEAVKLLADASFEPDARVILNDAPASLATPAADGGIPSDVDAKLVRDAHDVVQVRVRAPRGGFLVLSDTYYPGWTARVDGKPAPVHRANLFVRAVPLPRGEHDVVLRFEPQTQLRGRAITLATLALLVVVLVWSLVRIRRER